MCEGKEGDKESEVEIREFDHLLDYLGTGRWTLLYFCIFAVWKSCFALQSVGGAYMAPLMNHTCIHPPIEELIQDYPLYNDTSATPFNISITPIDECSYYVNSSEGDGQKHTCTEWDFDHSTFGDTLTSEMKLVCGRSFFVPLYQSVYMFGAACGSFIGGPLSDRIGRRIVFVWSTVTFVVLSSAISILPDIMSVLAFRAIIGALYMASTQAGYGIVMETTCGHVRPVAGAMASLPWGLGMVVYGGLGYSIRQWRYLQLVTSVPYILFFPALWFLNESPRWLLVHGHIKRAQDEINRAARWHGVQAPSNQTFGILVNNLRHQSLTKPKEIEENKTKRAWQWIRDRTLEAMVLFRTKKLCFLMLVIGLDFFTASLVYYGLALSAVNFSSDPYIYMCLSGMAEIPSYTLTGPIMSKLGRKAPAISCFVITGLALFVLPFIPKENGSMILALALIGKVTNTSVFMQLYVYASEVFPTEVRVQGLGMGLLFSRFGSIISPFINDVLVPVFPWMTSVFMGGLSVAAGIGTCLLPETRGATMPDVIRLSNKKSLSQSPTHTPTQNGDEERAAETMLKDSEA